MSELALTLDAEALVGAWLRDHDDLIDLNARVAVGEVPLSFVLPWVRVTGLDAIPVPRSGIDHALRYALQLDCYAGADAMAAKEGRREASLLARTVRAIVRAWKGSTRDGAVVCGATILSGPVRAPDTDLEPARERYVLTVELVMHPA